MALMFWWFQLRAISQLTGTAAAPTTRLKERCKEEEENAIGWSCSCDTQTVGVSCGHCGGGALRCTSAAMEASYAFVLPHPQTNKGMASSPVNVPSRGANSAKSPRRWSRWPLTSDG